ncbi:MAG TPA: heavy metal translocating P-type ATPase [Candidatus Saccharimonadales bacterium]
MKKIGHFLWHYRLFSLAMIAFVVSLVLWFLNYHTAANYILAIVSIFEVIPLLWGMLEDIRSGKYGIDILAATAIIASVLLHEYWAAIVVVIMLTGGESLEDYAEHRAQRELNNLLNNAPTKAHLLKNNKQVDIKVEELKVGDKFIIKPGELVPVDGIVIEGGSSFDEASLTGESVPVVKSIGDRLLSGSINLEGPITAKATSTSDESQYQQIVKLVQSAAASRAPFVRLADRYAVPFTLVAYAIAIGAWVYYGQAIRFLEVIIVATPCPLLLAAPIALISGMSLASRYGIIVKTGSALEKLAEAQTIAFDKTGTLTSGKLEVDKIVGLNDFSETDVLTYAAAIEQSSNHIIAKAIINHAKDLKLKLPKLKKQQEISGLGLVANLKSERLVVGRLKLIEDEGITIPKSLKPDKLLGTTMFIGLGAELVGYITFTDQIRPETAATLRSLRHQGLKHMLMITGDNQAAADAIAKELSIDSVKAEALPADKLKAVEALKLRPVAFVGDGVNDAPVLTSSDVGIALGASGSTAASESADMVIMLDDIGRVATAYKIAKHTFKIAKQSILVGIGLSLILMLIFSTGRFQPLYGAIIQEVVDVIVIFNALRAHNIKIKT